MKPAMAPMLVPLLLVCGGGNAIATSPLRSGYGKTSTHLMNDAKLVFTSYRMAETTIFGAPSC